MSSRDPLPSGPPARHPTRSTGRSRTAYVAAGSLMLLVVLTAVAACTSGGDSASPADSPMKPSSAQRKALRAAAADGADSGGAVSGEVANGPAAAPVPGLPANLDDLSSTTSQSYSTAAGGSGGAADVVRVQTDPDAQQQAIIRTAKIVLKDDDVGRARLDLLDVSDSVGGDVADEQSSSDKDGRLNATRLVLRVPTGRFQDAVDQIGKIGEQVVSEVHADDVTTQVVDVAARLKVQRASVARITQLLDRAQSIRDIVAIEGQLSQRTAALESLEQQQAYLADQTSLSTITVRVVRAESAEVAVAQPGKGRATASYHGFIGGLAAGWHALGRFGNGVAIGGGAVLPWLVVALLLGVPALLLVRRIRARRTSTPDVTSA